MSDRIPPNLEDAWRSELAGLEQRLLRVDDADLKAKLEARAAAIRANLGETPAAPVRGRRRANGAEVRPGGDGVEQA